MEISNQLPAGYLVMREGKCFAELVLDGKGQRDGKDEVGEGEVEDEDIPGWPHLFVFDNSENDQTVAHN